MRNFAIIILALIISGVSIQMRGQTPEKVDAVKYFDANKRWYNTFTEHWFQFFEISEQEIRESIVRWEKIGDSNDPNNQLAGTYWSGSDTHGEYLRWSPNQGFVWLHVDKCRGGPMRVIRGNVEMSEDGIILTPTVVLGGTEGHESHSGATKPIELIAVKWNGATFLVPKEEIESFADYAAGLGEFNRYVAYFMENPFLAKMGAEPETGKKSELPVFPAGYGKFLKKPVRGKIQSIGKWIRRTNEVSDNFDELVTRIRVVLENWNNSTANLRLFVVDAEQNFSETFTVKSLSKNIATVEYVRSAIKKDCVVTSNENCKDIDHITLRKGLILSSNGY